MISPRTETILRSIVRQYIVKATPVPSQSVTTDCGLGVSPATIRNEMASLEHEGYIIRPHTSAGSVPLDRGYRHYVESLGDIKLPLAEQRLISHLFHQVETALEEWVRLAATLIAQLAQNVAVVTIPKPADCQFKHLELITLQDSTVLVVLVLRGAKVRQQLVSFKQAISQPGLTAIVNKLNAAYADLTSSQILAESAGLSPTEQQITDCVLKIMQSEEERRYDEPYLDGLHFTLNQPEFIRGSQMQALVELAEQRNLLSIIIPPGLASRGVQVIIGKEHKEEVIHNYSVVIVRYGLPEEAVGTIGVLGPTRMPYARTIATVDYISSVLSELVARLYGRETRTDPA